MLNKRGRELNIITNISSLDKVYKEGAMELFKDIDVLEKYNIRIIFKNREDRNEKIQ